MKSFYTRLLHTLLITLFATMGGVPLTRPPALVVAAPVVPYTSLLLAPSGYTLGVQQFLDAQPGPLKHYAEEQTAATIIESSSLYYGLSPRLHLALLETVNALLSTSNPPASALRQPFGSAGPESFAAQIEWASRELRAGLGPYERPPTLRFTDGTTLTLTLEQAPEGIAVQRFLAIGRTAREWHTLVTRFGAVFQDYFDNELPDLVPPPSVAANTGFLKLPWPAGIRVVHLAYFDHAYPTVDTGPDGNDVVITYLGQRDVQYNGHDGHDYYFPDQPIGTPILAAAPGMAYARTHRGNGVVILHEDGYETIYWHLDQFAPIFDGRVDSNYGLYVTAGEMIGTSGATGFVHGSPHLHFEVRRHGRQVDPYGWYGPGADPCGYYAGCEVSGWLWHPSLHGMYDFTPPDSAHPFPHLTLPDHQPPVATLSINPPADLLFLARFDGHTLQEVGSGIPHTNGTPAFVSGRYGQALTLPAGTSLAYPVRDNLHLDAGSISLWARLPAHYPTNPINRHYLFATSANPTDDQRVYAGTLALRRDLLGPNNTPRWNFWTTPQSGEADRHDLTVPDTLSAGWHHFVITWDTQARHKTLFIDGDQVATTDAALLPIDVGSVLQIGQFTTSGHHSGIVIDELAIFKRALNAAEVADLAHAAEPMTASASVVNDPLVFLDTNAMDAEGGIVAVQPGLNGEFRDPRPYYDAYRWRLPASEGEHTLAVRYFDHASNYSEVSRTVTLDLPPQGHALLTNYDARYATLVITATDQHLPLSMQISLEPDFAGSAWQPLQVDTRWPWPLDQIETQGHTLPFNGHNAPPPIYVRFRDAHSNISAPVLVSMRQQNVYLPLIIAPQPGTASMSDDP